MAESEEIDPTLTLEKVVEDLGLYPRDAFDFLYEGLEYTVVKLRGPANDSKERRHISGQELCQGLRELALMKWGLLARTVLGRWHIHQTRDFGTIVFALVDSGLMAKTENDTIADFEAVYDFRVAFEADYRIEAKA